MSKLIEEKKRRKKYIKTIWNKLAPNQRKKLIKYLKDSFLSKFSSQILNMDYDDLYLIVKDHIQNSYELIKKWKETKS